jgi:hypothetical protein
MQKNKKIIVFLVVSCFYPCYRGSHIVIVLLNRFAGEWEKITQHPTMQGITNPFTDRPGNRRWAGVESEARKVQGRGGMGQFNRPMTPLNLGLDSPTSNRPSGHNQTRCQRGVLRNVARQLVHSRQEKTYWPRLTGVGRGKPPRKQLWIDTLK